MAKRKYPSMTDLDAFSRKRFPEIADRWSNAKRRHGQIERLLWVGTVATSFKDDEIAILEAMGFLSPMDLTLLRSIGRYLPPETVGENVEPIQKTS